MVRTEIARWEQVIVGDIPDVNARALDLSPVANDPDFAPCSIPPLIDDHFLCMVDGDIDGLSGTLGWAAILSSRNPSLLPSLSVSKLDLADIPSLSPVRLANVIRHELGHAVGSVHTNPFSRGCPSRNFTDSPEANRRFQQMSQCSFLVPTNGNAGLPGCGQ